ncbi:MAG: 4'-phosphopantetheinyl transferase superfamily protein [Bacteroidales bacterium]|nr:4'-phosphopantetheinyl transferase superfamily protein [Bacteroidales bacterium]
MPIFFKKQINDNILIGIWKISESAEWLNSKLILDKEDFEIFNSFKTELRKKHWLTYRILLKELIDSKSELKILYDESGKPYLKNSNYKISVSHSFEFAAAIVSRKVPAGIDIEKISQRIERIKNKFLSENELKDINESFRLEKLYIYWCAKEALYKLYGKRDLNFITNIKIAPFNFEQKGHINGELSGNSNSKKYKLFYEQVNDYMLVYVF